MFFTLSASSKECAKSLSSTFQPKFRIVIWHIFFRMGPKWKCPLRLINHLYKNRFQMTNVILLKLKRKNMKLGIQNCFYIFLGIMFFMMWIPAEKRWSKMKMILKPNPRNCWINLEQCSIGKICTKHLQILEQFICQYKNSI